MELGTLQNYIDSSDISGLYDALQAEYRSRFDPLEYRNFDPRTHQVIINRIKRPDRVVNKPVPNAYHENGQQVTEQSVVSVARISMPWQKQIVDDAVSFAVGGKIRIKCTPVSNTEKNLLTAVEQTWEDNKIQFRVKEIARRLFSETEVAVLWFSDKDDDNEPRVRMKIISPSDGEVLHPVFNSAGDMIGFAFEFLNGADQIQLDVYTAALKLSYVLDGTWQQVKRVDLNFRKIPVMYFNQEFFEWMDVQAAIDRIEFLLSSLADTNDYNASPIMIVDGEVKGMSDKGEAGKILEVNSGENNGKAPVSYLTWDKAPESMKLEIETLNAYILSKTRTVDLSLPALKGLGSVPSGASFDRMLIMPHMKAQDKQDGALGMGMQRMVNFIKAAHVNFLNTELKEAKKLRINLEYSLYRIDDIEERIQTVTAAMPGLPILSLRTAVTLIGVAQDVDEEVKTIQDENKPKETAGAA